MCVCVCACVCVCEHLGPIVENEAVLVGTLRGDHMEFFTASLLGQAGTLQHIVMVHLVKALLAVSMAAS